MVRFLPLADYWAPHWPIPSRRLGDELGRCAYFFSPTMPRRETVYFLPDSLRQRRAMGREDATTARLCMRIHLFVKSKGTTTAFFMMWFIGYISKQVDAYATPPRFAFFRHDMLILISKIILCRHYYAAVRAPAD